MGFTHLSLEVANPANLETWQAVECLVDSGAIYSVMPAATLESLGIKRIDTQEFRLANGEVIVRHKGIAAFRYGDRVGGADVIFGEEGDMSLLGVFTLESLGFFLDPLKRELRPLPMLLAALEPATLMATREGFRRLRRLRRTEALRRLVRETALSPADFVYPLFVTHGRDIRTPIGPMPGQFQLSLDHLLEEVAEAEGLGIPAVLLFGIPSRKDPEGSEAYDAQGIVQETVRAVKQAAPEMVVVTDVCLCEYTDHGHCGVLSSETTVDNDRSLELLARTAVSHAAAGADVVGPSAMMDGQVKAIRTALDAEGYPDVAIMAYSAKFASAFYGPFRIAAESAPRSGDRRGYQMDAANVREALRELEQDAAEGADLLMVKPALPYLDVLARARERFDLPLAAYNVSGEYAMVMAAAQNGWLDGQRAMLEVLTSIRRAGADIIITYHAKEAARLLRTER